MAAVAVLLALGVILGGIGRAAIGCADGLSVRVEVDGRAAIGGRTDETAETFVCATLDWWPPDKCDYGTCSWGNASLLNLVRHFNPKKFT